MHGFRPLIAVVCGALLTWSSTSQAQAPSGTTVSHGFAIHGDLKYRPDFPHFEYADPNAVRGGDVRFSAIGSFDNLNPFILRGTPAVGSASIYDSLMATALDEPSSHYCLICETIEYPEDRSWTQFVLRREARFHDGSPITAADVVWTFETLRAQGHPRYRSYYASVTKAEAIDARTVRFTFTPGQDNREMPLIIGELPVLPRAYWQNRQFDRTTLEVPMGSGPYRIESFEAGRYIVLRRVPDYWAQNLPVRIGHFNFDTIRYDYYRDGTVALEAFKAGEYDIRLENQALAWATGYDTPALRAGLYRRDEIPEERVAGMQGFGMNLRRPQFTDRRVRLALSHAYDFDTANRTLFHGAYTRTRSYFDNSELAARGLPNAEELAVLEPLRAQLPAEVFTTEYQPPRTPGTGIEGWRENRRIATRLLTEAGFRITNNRLVDAQGRALEFEMLLNSPQFERIVLPYRENLRALGIEMRVRTVDPAQYQRRMDEFDYDMTVVLFGQSQSPGNEQRDYWMSDRAEVQGSNNQLGLRDPAIDRLVELLIAAPNRAALVTRTRALDRVLQWGHYVVPNWHLAVDRVAYWDRFGRPSTTSRVGFLSAVWWVDPQKDAALRARRGQAPR